jgi:excinuclease UvrABC nuclease subunit
MDNLFTDPKSFPRHSPHFSCVYFLWDGDELVYVGKSTNGLSRVYAHVDKVFTEVSYQVVDPSYIDILEQTYIKVYKPKYNKILYDKPDRNYTCARGLHFERPFRNG